MLETEWVLRSVYGYEATALAKALGAFACLPSVTIEDAAMVAQSLDWMETGHDFVDALHLAKANDCDAFVTFDQRLARAANTIGTIRVRSP